MALFAVATVKGPRWEPTRGIREQDACDQHAAFLDRLVEQGVVILGGPIASTSDEDVAPLAVEAADERDVRSKSAPTPGPPTRCSASRTFAPGLDGSMDVSDEHQG